jgi:hypothetical protein
VVDRVTLGAVSPFEEFGFALSVSFDECSILIFITKFLLPRTNGRSLETTNREALDRKMLSFFHNFKRLTEQVLLINSPPRKNNPAS